MARRPPKYRQEQRFRQEVKRGLDDVKSARKVLRDAEKAALSGRPKRFKPFAKLTNADYRRLLSVEKKFGLADRVMATDLTPSKKRTIRKHWRELEYLFENSTFVPYPVGIAPKSKKRVQRDVRRFFPNPPGEEQYHAPGVVAPKRKQRVTRKGVFKPTGQRQIGAKRGTQSFGGESERVVVEPNIGTLKYDRETDTWAIEVRRKTREGLYVKELNYIAGPEVLEAKQERLRRRFEGMPKPKRNQRLRFFMNGNPPNASSKTFRNMEELFRFAAHYRKDDQARASFLQEITIAVVQQGAVQYRAVGKRGHKKKIKDRWHVVSGFRGSNYHEVDPDDFMIEMEDDDE